MKDRGRQTFTVLFWMLAAVILVLGVSQLFVLRFERGDIYPVYSSLRSDPLGTKVLYDSLLMQPNLSVSRNYMPFNKLEADTNTVLLIPGASPSLAYSRSLRSFVMQGGRLVLLFYPRQGERLYFGSDDITNVCYISESTNKTEDADTTNVCMVASNSSSCSSCTFTSAIPRLSDGLDLDRVSLTNDDFAIRVANMDLPLTLSCHTALCFTNVTNSWSIIYQRDDYPVVIEKSEGRGSVLISTISFFISNEAMRDERHPDLLCWLLGDRTNIIFDEYHSHIRKSMHVIDFVKQYHLLWFGAVSLLLAILYIWRSSCSLVPPQPDTPKGMQCELESGNDSFAGLINLLRRSIPRNQLLRTCFDEWSSSPRAKHATTAHQRAQMESTIHNGSAASDQIPAHYNTCCTILKKRQKLKPGRDAARPSKLQRSRVPSVHRQPVLPNENTTTLSENQTTENPGGNDHGH